MTEITTDTSASGRPLSTAANENRALSAAEVVAALTYVEAGTAPQHALEAALAMPADLGDLIVEELSLAPLEIRQRYENAPSDTSAYYLHEIAMHLMAAWRDPRGWQLVLDYYVSDCDLAVELSDIGTEAYLPAILVRCYDGSDLRSFERIIETTSLDPLFRQSCLQAYHGLVLARHAPRVRLIGFLARLLKVSTETSPVEWSGWLALRAAELQDASLRPAIEALLAGSRAASHDHPSCVVSKEDIETIYSTPPSSIAASILADDHFDDIPASISEWNWFTPQPARELPLTLPWTPTVVSNNADHPVRR